MRSYEISKRRNQRKQIVLIINNYNLISYNGNNYDDILLNYINEAPDCDERSINVLSQAIIKYGRTKDENILNIYKPFKYGLVNSQDVMTMLASSKIRVSLKHLQVIIKWENVQEFECDWTVDLPEARWDECIKYCENDVLSLEAVCLQLEKDFQLRDFVEKQTGLDVKSKDPVKIAEYTMCKAITGLTGRNLDRKMRQMANNNTRISRVVVKDLILPFIKFDTPVFQDLLYKYRTLSFDPKEEATKPKNQKIKFPVIFHGIKLNFGLGGLHHEASGSQIVKPGPNEKLYQADVSSYYPSLRIHHLKHPHDPEFLNEYVIAYKEKAEAKAKKNKMLEGYAKLRLNSTFGLYNSIYSPLYAPLIAYGTTINGQLCLAMLIEKLHAVGIKIVGTNTDAVNVIIPDDKWDVYKKVCAEWEKITSMKLDQDQFDVIYEHSCNNYIGIMKGGYVKTKGFFVDELNLLKGYDYPIVKIALREYFINNVSPEKTLFEHQDIYDFCMSNKMGTAKNGNRFIAYHNNVRLQSTNRYYASKGADAGYLYKSAGGPMQHVLKDSGVKIFNKYVKKDMKDYNINYDYYLREINKIIREIEPEQLSLF